MRDSEWSIPTLKEHIEKILAEKDKAINIALAAAKEAVQVAESNAEKWRANANEWRGAMSDREKNFATKSEVFAIKENIEKALSVEKERADIGSGRSSGVSQGWVLATGVVIFVITVFGGIVAIITFVT